MRAILTQGLETTASSWPEIRVAFGWVRRFAAILGNKPKLDSAEVRRRYSGLIASLARHRKTLGSLAAALDHFRKVTRSYWAGVFRVACPGTVVRGSVRLVSAAATRLRTIEVSELVPSDLQAWRKLRGSLEQRQGVRTLGRRFRKDPDAYLKPLKNALINQNLPA